MQRNNIDPIFDSSLIGLSAGAGQKLFQERAEGKRCLSAVALAILNDVRRLMTVQSIEQPEFSPIERDLLEWIALSARKLGIDLLTLERDEILAELSKENSSFGILQPLVDSVEVSDIIVHDYSHIVVQCGRATIRTDLSFVDQRTYEAYVERLLQRAGTTYSNKKPIADGMIGTHARIHVVHRCLCETGPYLTIRINRLARVSTDDLIAHGSAPRAVFDYLRKMVRIGMTVFVVGEVGTGKTTLVRALAAAIPERESILVIEDTPEIQLEHPHVRALTTREVNTEGVGKISPSECIRAGMRMAMNRIIFGEIRDAEAAEAFIDVCASGHAGVSTIHARSAAEALTRLELFLGRAQRGTSRQVIAEQIVTAVQVIVFVSICPFSGKRTVFEVREIGPVADGVIRQREIFRYVPDPERPSWRVVTRASTHRDLLERGESPVHLSGLSQTLFSEVVGSRNQNISDEGDPLHA